MNILIRPKTRRPQKSVAIGAPVGNKNRELPKGSGRESVLHMRCLGADKGAWTDAANISVKHGQFKPDGRGNLASWVVFTLNAAADAQLGPRRAAERKRSSEGGDATK